MGSWGVGGTARCMEGRSRPFHARIHDLPKDGASGALNHGQSATFPTASIRATPCERTKPRGSANAALKQLRPTRGAAVYARRPAGSFLWAHAGFQN